MAKVLIAYFSRRGSNYVAGSVVELEKGNTEVLAEKIQALTGGDLFHIEPVTEYPNDYYKLTEIAKEELQNNKRPELTSKVEDMSQYDTVILGYPNWWGTFPVAVMTFLESYDFSGKTIFPLCTHEGGGIADSIKDITKLCPASDVKSGLAIYGHAVKTSNIKVENWLRTNEIIQ